MTNIDPAAIDRTHEESLRLIEQIRAHVSQLRTQAAMWVPRDIPSPGEWPDHQNCYRHRRRNRW